MVLDPVADFVELTVLQGYDASATQIDIVTTDTHFDLLPDPTVDGAYNLLWYDDTNYAGRPQDDPNREWVRVTNWNEGAKRLIVTRGTAGTSASTKNTSGATYKLIMAIGAKWRDDIEAAGIDVGSKYAWITEYDGVGDGVTDDWQAFDDAKDAGITHLIIPEGTWRFSADFTFPDTMTLEFKRNAVLAPDAAKTIALNGPIVAGNWQIFGGSGTCTCDERVGIQYDRWDNTAVNGAIIGNADEGGVALKLENSSNSNETLSVTQHGIAEAIKVYNAATGAGDGIFIENDGTGDALSVQQDGDGYAVYIAKTDTDGTVACVAIANDADAFGIDLDQNGSESAISVTQATAFPAIESELGASTTEVVTAKVTGDTYNRLSIRTDGQVAIGPGSGAADTNLYRSAADTLKTDDAFESATSVKATTVFKMTPRTSAPGSPASGDIAIADRTNWDPSSLGDGGQYPAIYDGSAWKAIFPFKVVESAEVDCSAGGGKTCQIAHGLSYTPAAKDICIANTYVSSGSGSAILRTLSINSIDATNVDLYFYVISSASGTSAKVVLWIRI